MLEVALFVSLVVAKTADLPPGAVLRLGDARWRAGDQIHRLWFSADGKSLSAGTVAADKTPRTTTWAAATGRRLATADDPPDGDARSVRLKGGRTLTIGPDWTVEVRDAAGRRTATLGGHTATVTAVASSADGTRLATGDLFGLVRVWDAATLRPLNHPTGHTGPVGHAELSPDGKRLLTWAWDDTVRVWDVTTGRELRAVPGAVGWIAGRHGFRQRPTFTPDGSAVLFATSEGLAARDVTTGLEVPLRGELTGAKPAVPAFGPDGKSVLTCWYGVDQELAVYDWPSGKKRFAVEVKTDHDEGVPGFSPDGSAVFAFSTSPDRWDAKTGKPLPPAWKDDRWRRVHSLLSLRPNPHHLIDTSGDEPRVIRAGTDAEVAGVRLAYSGDPLDGWYSSRGVALAPSGRQLAMASGIESGDVYLYESASGRLRRTLAGHRGTAGVLGFTPDGTKLLTAGADHTVLVWDVRLQSVPLPDAVRGETNAAKLWATMCAGKPDAAYLATARLAAEPDAAVKTARLRIRAADKNTPDHAEQRLADMRAVELLESLGTPEAREFLKELAVGEESAWRTQEAKRALERLGK